MDLAAKHGVVLADAGVNDLHFRYDRPDGPVYVKLHAQGGKYALDILRPASLHSQVDFGNGQYADRGADGENGSPEPPMITDYPNSQCTSFTYNEFNTLELADATDGERAKNTVEGRYWDKSINSVRDGDL